MDEVFIAELEVIVGGKIAGRWTYTGSDLEYDEEYGEPETFRELLEAANCKWLEYARSGLSCVLQLKMFVNDKKIKDFLSGGKHAY